MSEEETETEKGSERDGEIMRRKKDSKKLRR
jgi:hypothetical protein